jgi:hypothetical protein
MHVFPSELEQQPTCARVGVTKARRKQSARSIFPWKAAMLDVSRLILLDRLFEVKRRQGKGNAGSMTLHMVIQLVRCHKTGRHTYLDVKNYGVATAGLMKKVLTNHDNQCFLRTLYGILCRIGTLVRLSGVLDRRIQHKCRSKHKCCMTY